MDNPQHKKQWVSTSAIRKSCYCPHLLELENRGFKPSQNAQEAMEQGTIAHEAFNQQTQQDRRCFIATHLYGQDHPNTQTLRNFRDFHMGDHVLGRCCIRFYYRVSPWLVKFAKEHPWMDRVLRAAVNSLVKLIRT